MDRVSFDICSNAQKQVLCFGGDSPLWSLSQNNCVSSVLKSLKSYVYYDKLRGVPALKYRCCQSCRPISKSSTGEKKVIQNTRKMEQHLWRKRDSAGSGQKALNLVRIISGLPSEKEQVYSSLDKWIAWETEFPLVAAAKALKILRKRNQWQRVIQVAKWMLSKGQGATLATYDCLLLAFDMDGRADEAQTLWNMILHAHDRSISKRLFSRMISLYDHHDMPNMIIEVFADMEELGVRPDEDTVRRVARAFDALGQKEKQRLVIGKYGSKWKYIHFKGERVWVRTCSADEISCSDLGEFESVHAPQDRAK
ncbi:pentatricopeptide repeat-containing protein At4g18975, chloroplastic-like isoform X2 [Henckelia pumila]|uniref:pentatricopeptide repeat-containing protein At4g18975, chloroplastic-like isoform X2 n=1 Tax=Henckelia pumila TaxID=405737 RepID=UPI003C6E208F